MIASTILCFPVIETAPKIIAGPKEYKVKKGEDVTFTVKFSGSPKPSEEWTVNGTVVKPSKRVVQSSDDESASLTIKKIEETDVGNYTIKLKNNVGEASAELTLIIVGEYFSINRSRWTNSFIIICHQFFPLHVQKYQVRQECQKSSKSPIRQSL